MGDVFISFVCVCYDLVSLYEVVGFSHNDVACVGVMKMALTFMYHRNFMVHESCMNDLRNQHNIVS